MEYHLVMLIFLPVLAIALGIMVAYEVAPFDMITEWHELLLPAFLVVMLSVAWPVTLMGAVIVGISLGTTKIVNKIRYNKPNKYENF